MKYSDKQHTGQQYVGPHHFLRRKSRYHVHVKQHRQSYSVYVSLNCTKSNKINETKAVFDFTAKAVVPNMHLDNMSLKNWVRLISLYIYVTTYSFCVE
jgi:hypothetical protein